MGWDISCPPQRLIVATLRSLQTQSVNGLGPGHKFSSARPQWRYLFRQWVWTGVDLIFPPQCGGCGKAGERFCATCLASLASLPQPQCAQCGYPLPPSGHCVASHLSGTAALAGIRSAFFFEGPVQRALHRLKYKRDIILADSLACLLREAWRAYDLPGDLVVPVPLSAERLRERGYNQANLLARAFAELTRLPYLSSGAVRIRHTASQVKLSAAQRRENVACAFEAKPQVVFGQTIILIDDVCTTGATLAACAEALRAAGAAGVWGFTLARAR